MAILLMLLPVGLGGAYYLVSFDYWIGLIGGFSIVNSPLVGHVLVLERKPGGGAAGHVLGGIATYSVEGEFIVGALGPKVYQYAVKRPQESNPERADEAISGGYFIVDAGWSDRLYTFRLQDRNLVNEWWYPPVVLYGSQQRADWERALTILGVQTPIKLRHPSRWQAKIAGPHWVAWGFVLGCWLVLFLHMRR